MGKESKDVKHFWQFLFKISCFYRFLSDSINASVRKQKARIQNTKVPTLQTSINRVKSIKSITSINSITFCMVLVCHLVLWVCYGYGNLSKEVFYSKSAVFTAFWVILLMQVSENRKRAFKIQRYPPFKRQSIASNQSIAWTWVLRLQCDSTRAVKNRAHGTENFTSAAFVPGSLSPVGLQVFFSIKMQTTRALDAAQIYLLYREFTPPPSNQLYLSINQLIESINQLIESINHINQSIESINQSHQSIKQDPLTKTADVNSDALGMFLASARKTQLRSSNQSNQSHLSIASHFVWYWFGIWSCGYAMGMGIMGMGSQAYSWGPWRKPPISTFQCPQSNHRWCTKWDFLCS